MWGCSVWFEGQVERGGLTIVQTASATRWAARGSHSGGNQVYARWGAGVLVGSPGPMRLPGLMGHRIALVRRRAWGRFGPCRHLPFVGRSP